MPYATDLPSLLLVLLGAEGILELLLLLFGQVAFSAAPAPGASVHAGQRYR